MNILSSSTFFYLLPVYPRYTFSFYYFSPAAPTAYATGDRRNNLDDGRVVRAYMRYPTRTSFVFHSRVQTRPRPDAPPITQLPARLWDMKFTRATLCLKESLMQQQQQQSQQQQQQQLQALLLQQCIRIACCAMRGLCSMACGALPFCVYVCLCVCRDATRRWQRDDYDD